MTHESMMLIALSVITALMITTQLTLLDINHKLTILCVNKHDIVHYVRVDENGDEVDEEEEVDDTESTVIPEDEPVQNDASQTDVVQDAD